MIYPYAQILRLAIDGWKGMITMSMKSLIGAAAAGAVVGAVAGMMLDPINDKQHKKIQRCANNMFKTIGTIMDDLMGM